jgi:arylsulfatase A-like enzyme
MDVDFMPTMLELCNVTTKREFHGVSLVDLINGKSDEYKERVVVTDNQRVPIPVKWNCSCVMKGNIRLINGGELYDLTDDPGQQTDISQKNPQLVRVLRAEYDKWWDIVSARFSEPIPLELGGEATCLRAHDLRGNVEDVVWSQGEVRAGKMVDSYYEIEVMFEGEYEFELRRWCAEN